MDSAVRLACWKAGLIPVDRSAGMAALARMTARAQQDAARGRADRYFSRRHAASAGRRAGYKPGIAHLYNKAACPACRSRLIPDCSGRGARYGACPGTILVDVLDPIAPGLDKRAFLARLQSDIETASARMIEEAVDQGPLMTGLAVPVSRCGQQMQIGLAIAERFQRPHRFEHIVAIGTGLAVTLPHVMHAFGERQPAGILHVAAIDDVAQRAHAPPRLVFELDPAQRFHIDRGDLFARRADNRWSADRSAAATR